MASSTEVAAINVVNGNLELLGTTISGVVLVQKVWTCTKYRIAGIEYCRGARFERPGKP